MRGEYINTMKLFHFKSIEWYCFLTLPSNMYTTILNERKCKRFPFLFLTVYVCLCDERTKI